MALKVGVGPILGLRKTSSDSWTLTALVAGERATGGELTWRCGARHWACQPTEISPAPGKRIDRYEMILPLSDADQRVEYSLGEWTRWFSLPARCASPRLAYASCNGFSEPKLMKRVGDINNRWTHLLAFHMRQELPATQRHLLLLGGDQIYSDSIWTEVSELDRWVSQSRAKRLTAAFTSRLEAQVNDFYFRLYCQRWSQPEPARAFASMPSLMMWDDHDIFDGWGSHGDELQACPVFQGIFRCARQWFRAFQLQLGPNEVAPAGIPRQEHFSFLHVAGEIAVLGVDMRSERTESQVLSGASWNAIFDGIRAALPVKHLVVMSSIPVVYPDFSGIERFLGVLPGKQEIEDDLRDHWHSRQHREERLTLVHRLLAFASENDVRVTLVSGDVHVGAVGTITSTRAGHKQNHSNIITQLTSSGIVHPPPPGMVAFALNHLDQVEFVDRGITAEMSEFPGMRDRYLLARNWMSIDPDDKGRLWAQWHIENDPHPLIKCIHPVRSGVGP